MFVEVDTGMVKGIAASTDMERLQEQTVEQIRMLLLVVVVDTIDLVEFD